MNDRDEEMDLCPAAEGLSGRRDAMPPPPPPPPFSLSQWGDLFGVLRAVERAGGLPLYIVGGFVRDHLLGNTSPLDVDVVSIGPAHPRDVAETFQRCAKAAFPSDGATADGVYVLERQRCSDVAITLFRGIRIDITRAQSMETDALSRDLTINALYYGVESGTISDPTGHGMEDLLRHRLLRAAGPDALVVDPIRALRVVRFREKLRGRGFVLDASLESALCAEHIPRGLAAASRHRIADELRALLLGTPEPSNALHFMARHRGWIASCFRAAQGTCTVGAEEESAMAETVHEGCVRLACAHRCFCSEALRSELADDFALEHFHEMVLVVAFISPFHDGGDNSGGSGCDAGAAEVCLTEEEDVPPPAGASSASAAASEEDRETGAEDGRVAAQMLRSGLAYGHKKCGMCLRALDAMPDVGRLLTDWTKDAAHSFSRVSVAACMRRLRKPAIFDLSALLSLSASLAAVVPHSPRDADLLSLQWNEGDVVENFLSFRRRIIAERLDTPQIVGMTPLLTAPLMRKCLHTSDSAVLRRAGDMSIDWQVEHPDGTRNDLRAFLRTAFGVPSPPEQKKRPGPTPA